MLYGKCKRLEKLNPSGGSEKLPFIQQLTFSSAKLWKLPADIGPCIGDCLLPSFGKPRDGFVCYCRH